jgi:hypothetical protein
MIMVRSTADPDGITLKVSRNAWLAWVSRAKNGVCPEA